MTTLTRPLLNSLLFFPSAEILETPERADLDWREVDFETEDGETLQGWSVRGSGTRAGHVMLLHGNAGNIGDRVLHAALLAEAGFDTFLFDYRGYGRSTGRPGEEGTYRDARAAQAALLSLPGIDPGRILYLGESLGGAVAVELALERPPAGLVLLSTFTGVRELARLHYPLIPGALIPDAYPTLQRIGDLRAPLLLIHGENDEIVPVSQAHELYEAAAEPKRIHTIPAVGHNDLVPLAGRELARTVAEWADDLGRS